MLSKERIEALCTDGMYAGVNGDQAEWAELQALAIRALSPEARESIEIEAFNRGVEMSADVVGECRVLIYSDLPEVERMHDAAKQLQRQVRALKVSTPQPEVAASDDAARLDWLEAYHTLHKSVDILYVVDGYEVTVMHEDGITELSPRYHGSDLREAIDKARAGNSSQPQERE